MRLVCAIIFTIIYNNVEFGLTTEIRTNHNETARVYDTIVVGVGAAGSAALGKLARAGRSVLGLEAADRVGGRVRTVPFGHGVVEVGAEWIHGTKNSVTYELAVANNISVAYQNGVARVFRSNGNELDRELVKDLIGNCTDESDIMKKNQSSGEYFTKTCMDYMAKNKPELAKDETFVSLWLDFLSLLMVSGDAADDWKDAATISTYEDLDKNLMTSWHKWGYKTLFEILLNKYNNGPGLPTAEIKQNKEVTQVVWSEDPAADVVVKCADGTEYKAKNVIVTVSLGVLKHRNVTTSFTPVYDTIVVGVGAAGSAALGKLARAGRSVLGLEAADRVGGRVRTVPFGHGVVEVGAEWIHGINNSVTYELAVANNISIVNQDGVMRAFRSNGTELDSQLIQDLVGNCTDETDILKKNQSSAEYYIKTCSDYIAKNKPELEKDEALVSSWLDFLGSIIVAGDAADDWKDVAAISSYEHLDEHHTASWHKWGYKTLFEIMLNKYNDGPGLPTAEIKLNKEVTQVVWSEDPAADVVVKCADGTEYRAKNVIVTVSLGVLKHSYTNLFSPPLPEPKVEAINQISMGLLGKIILSFDKRWWSDNDLFFGFLWSKEDKEQISPEDAWTTRIGYASHSMGSDNVLVMWTNGATARHVETLSDEVVKEQAVKVLRKFLGPNVPEATGIIRTTWYSNPFTRGTYTFDNLDTPKHPLAREDLARPLLDSARQPRVLFAGEATNTPHYGTVHGAVETGIREANRLLGDNKMTLTL